MCYAKIAYVEPLPRRSCILEIVCTILAEENKKITQSYILLYRDYKRDIYNNYKYLL